MHESFELDAGDASHGQKTPAGTPQSQAMSRGLQCERQVRAGRSSTSQNCRLPCLAALSGVRPPAKPFPWGAGCVTL